ncbi:MAG: aspartate--tRNA ligase [Candidatus Cloacimonadota bacterium]|nr:MAG: aspartate--tRNA ligase [Candidatus Cloacimonadota bacterium]
MLRSHHLGQLTDDQLTKKITLCGWADRVRAKGGVNFIVLRDRYAKLQLNIPQEIMEKQTIGREYCLKIEGVLNQRPEKDRKDDKNGAYELQVSALEVLNKSDVPPFIVDDREEINEELRLKYRYLDLRRDCMKNVVMFRIKLLNSVRSYLNSQEFLEVETPMLMKAMPEGARDFLVPSRNFPGEFYALPQSPQLYKQLIQVCGLDRYFQFARCFRDEDARGDRQMVHTQIDLEMSFVEEEDIFATVEGFLNQVFVDCFDKKIDSPFMRLTYDECMKRFGVDKPDLRFGMELFDLDEIMISSPYSYFKEVVDAKGRIAGFTVKGGAKSLSRKEIDKFSDYVKAYRSKGVFWAKVVGDDFNGGITKNIPQDQKENLLKLSGAVDGDLIVFIADTHKITNDSIGNLRNHIAKKIEIIPKNVYKFLWVTDFPMFEYDEDLKCYQAMHHLFTMPKEEHIKYFETGELEKMYGCLYDLVMNGVELGSGSIRIHTQEMQQKVFDIVGMSREDQEERFGFFLEALKFGAPPHGGIALGVARLVMTLLGLDNMRDAITFPNASSTRYALDNSPSKLDQETLDDLQLQVLKSE